MNKREILPLLSRLGVTPSRKLGQNFLIDANCLASMVRIAAPVAGETILEVGPGTGVLTERLLAAGAKVVAVELDHRLAGYLKERFADNPQIEIIEYDACKLDYGKLPQLQTPYRCIANLPYSCGSVFLSKICSGDNPPRELFVLLQKEMGERLAAAVGTKQYGSLTARLALRYRVAIEKLVPPSVFFPPPEVASAFVSLKLREEAAMENLPAGMDAVVSCAFSQRRKKAARLLESLAAKDRIAQAFAELGLDENIRAEDISPEQYRRLAELLP